jgi:hypothetical protein
MATGNSEISGQRGLAYPNSESIMPVPTGTSLLIICLDLYGWTSGETFCHCTVEIQMYLGFWPRFENGVEETVLYKGGDVGRCRGCSDTVAGQCGMLGELV